MLAQQLVNSFAYLSLAPLASWFSLVTQFLLSICSEGLAWWLWLLAGWSVGWLDTVLSRFAVQGRISILHGAVVPRSGRLTCLGSGWLRRVKMSFGCFEVLLLGCGLPRGRAKGC